MGRTKLMAKSLGRTATDEPVPGISRLTAHMRGQVGLLFTPRQPEDVLSFLDGYAASSFARAGTVATDTVSIPAGVVYLRSAGTPGDTVDDYPLTVTAEPHVRAMGMPTRIERGKVVLDADYDICKEGDVLTGFKASLLRTFGREMARFALRATA